MIKNSSSVRIIGVSLLAVGTLGSVAFAQDVPSHDLPENGGAGIRSGNITSSGETVPNPGVSQSAGTTPMDRGIEQQDTKIQSSICKGC